jgi:predicted metal-dependent phosphoesterase TrpH
MFNSGVKADFHCHTHASDNSFSIADVIDQAIEAGLTHLAITDHDTTMGIKEAVQIGQEKGLTIIPGIEISAKDPARKTRAHLLGLYIDPTHQAIEELCRPTINQRHEASKQMVAAVIELGYDLNWEMVSRYAQHGSAVYKQHIMHALMDKGYCKEIHGKLHDTLFSRSNQETGMALVRIEYPDAIDAIRAIRLAGGVAVLAHPGQLGNFDAVEEWTSAGLQGLEAFHPSHTVEQLNRTVELAHHHGLILTGGADYHGLYGSAKYPLGCVTVGEEELNKLLECKG